MKLKRLIAGVVSAAMMLSIGSTLAFAVDGDYETGEFVDTVTVNSIMNLSEDAVSAPNVTYTYTLTAGDPETYTETDAEKGTTTSFGIYAGELNGVTITSDTDDTASITTGDSASTSIKTTVSFYNTDYATDNTVEKELEIDFSALVEGADALPAGMYHYVLTESTDSTLDTLVNDSTTTRHIYVTILNNANGGVYISYTKMVDASYVDDEVTALKSDSYEHSYGIYNDDGTTPTDPGEAGGTGAVFIVTDTAFGTYADHSKDFTFSIVATTGAATDGETYISEGSVFKLSDGTYIMIGTNGVAYVADYDENPEEGEEPYTITTSTAYQYLSSAENFSILGVADGMTFTVTITDPTDDGYSFYARLAEVDYSYTTADEMNAWAEAYTYTATFGENTIEDATVDVEGIDFATVRGADVIDETDPTADDDKGIEYTSGGYPDTGVILEFAPFVLMVLAAGAFIGFRVYTTIKKK